MKQERGHLREQLNDACSSADYPVTSAVDVISALPNGVRTEFQAGDHTITVADLISSIGGKADFPYESPEHLAEDVIEALEETNSLK